MDLDRPQCLELLASVSVGRIVFTAGPFPVVEPVTFTLAQAHVVFQVPPAVPLVRLTEEIVGFQADNATPQTEPDWTVTVAGPTRLLQDHPATSTQPRCTVLALSPTTISGHRCRPPLAGEQSPPIGQPGQVEVAAGASGRGVRAGRPGVAAPVATQAPIVPVDRPVTGTERKERGRDD